MGEFFKKNGSTIISGGIITGLFAMIGGSIASLIRSDKRALKWYKKQDEIQQEQLTYWKNQNEKES